MNLDENKCFVNFIEYLLTDRKVWSDCDREMESWFVASGPGIGISYIDWWSETDRRTGP